MRAGCWLVLVLLGANWAGAQTFHPGVSYATQNGPLATATGDFNGDGKLDLAVGNGASSSVSIFLGNGDGSFNAGAIVKVPGNCMVAGLSAADFTGDGKLDLLVVCGFQTTLWVLPGLGNGQFAAGISTPLQQLALVGFAEGTFEGLAVADFNGDGKPDLALALSNNDLSGANVAMMLGNGNGTFQPPLTVLATGIPANVVAGDMNGDGKPDLVAAVSQAPNGPSLLLVMLGDGKGGFQKPAAYQLSTEALLGYTLIADVNRDGIADVVMASAELAASGGGTPASTLTVFTGKGDGTLSPGFSVSEPNLILALVAADFRGTGAPDLVEMTATSLDSSGDLGLSTREGNGDGTFQAPVSLPVPNGVLPWWFGMIVADWNGDGLPDFAYLSLPSLLNLVGSSGSGLSQVPAFFDQLGQGSLVVTINSATPPPLIAVSHPQLQFSYLVGAAAPAAQPVAISNGRSGALNWTATANASWLTVSPASGTAPSTVQVSVAAGLAANTYTGTVTIASSGASNTPLQVAVTLVVSAASAGPVIASVVNGASFQPGIESGSWVTIKGTNLANSAGQIWAASDFVNGNLPTSLAKASVTIDGRPAYTYYVSTNQINVQAPTDANLGTVNVVVTNNGAPSQPFPATLQATSPAFFEYSLSTYAIATRYPDNALIGNPSAVSGTVAAKAGDILILWATGFGATSPATPAGIVVSGAPAVATMPAITVGGTAVPVISAVLSPGSAGLYQIAIQLPANVPTGIVALQASVAGVQSPAGVDLLVGN
jgi:uncharacterized protein (TIGR03437 family)